MQGPDHPSREVLRQRAHSRAQQRARQRLVEAHRGEFQQLLEQEKALEGIPKLASRQVTP